MIRSATRIRRSHESERGELRPSDGFHGLAIHFQSRVQLSHRCNVEAAAQLSQGGDRGGLFSLEPAANKRRGLVRWEESLVVSQHDEIVLLDKAIGRVAIDDIHPSRSERLVFHSLPQRTNAA